MICVFSNRKSATYAGSIVTSSVFKIPCKVVRSPGFALNSFCQVGSVLPPTDGNFSATITRCPRCSTLAAAVKPAPPAPITTTSVSYSTGGTCRFALGRGRFLRTSGSPPANFTASATPSMTPLLVTEAPETVSTFNVCPLKICAGIFSNTTSAIPAVSALVSISIFSILSSENSTDIGNFPLCPMAVTS